VDAVVGGMGCRVPYVENQGAEVERHWVARGCCCSRRNYDDFSNQGCMCLSRGCSLVVDVG